MSYKSGSRTVTTPEFWADSKEQLRKISQSVNGVLAGQTNNHFQVTLIKDETSMVVPFSSARIGAAVLMFPQNLLASQLTGVFAESGPSNGEVTISHGIAVGGESFSLVIIG